MCYLPSTTYLGMCLHAVCLCCSRRTSSSAASCSTSCHAAFTASGITACSPVQHAKQVLRVPASCLASCPRQSLSNCQSRSIISRLSLLRRAHVHHRDLRALEATPRATSRICTNRERPLVTRHALRSSHAATPPLRRMRPYALFAKLSATGPNMILVANSGAQPDHATACRAANREIRVSAERASLCHSATLTRLIATAVMTCCKRVFANPI